MPQTRLQRMAGLTTKDAFAHNQFDRVECVLPGARGTTRAAKDPSDATTASPAFVAPAKISIRLAPNLRSATPDTSTCHVPADTSDIDQHDVVDELVDELLALWRWYAVRASAPTPGHRSIMLLRPGARCLVSGR
jgi:hypothetical protein